MIFLHITLYLIYPELQGRWLKLEIKPFGKSPANYLQPRLCLMEWENVFVTRLVKQVDNQERVSMWDMVH